MNKGRGLGDKTFSIFALIHCKILIPTTDMFDNLKRISYKNKNNKAAYYLKAHWREIVSRKSFQKKLEQELSKIENYDDKEYILNRVNYYNKLTQVVKLPTDKTINSTQLLKPQKLKVYNFDTYEVIRYFPDNYRFCPLFGDVIHIPDEPSLTKSRPIEGENTNSVILKLEKLRHFLFVKDEKKFADKKDMAIFRGKADGKPHRLHFLEMYYDHPMCNVGQLVKKDKLNEKYVGNRLTIAEHLNYKFITSLEGNDVASNLKWVMSSNSLAIMPKPTYETWFMEGTLIPNYHYVLIKDDYSDLEERMKYYIDHPDEAQKIIDNAHAYIDQFRDLKREKLISLMVLNKYFKMTGQK